jgi:hypothetical protein
MTIFVADFRTAFLAGDKRQLCYLRVFFLGSILYYGYPFVVDSLHIIHPRSIEGVLCQVTLQ